MEKSQKKLTNKRVGINAGESENSSKFDRFLFLSKSFHLYKTNLESLCCIEFLPKFIIQGDWYKDVLKI